MAMDGFEGQGKGSLELGPKDLFPTTAQLSDKLQARLGAGAAGAAPNQRAGLEIDTDATIGDSKP
jgi:hypothetical protein